MTADGAFNAWFSLMTTVSVLLLVSLGLAVVFGLRRVINLAHGEFIMFGAFATLTATRAGIGLWVAMLIAIAVTAAFGLVVELAMIRHLYERPADTMLATWGLSLILVQVAANIYGSVTEGIPTPLGSFGVGDYSMSTYNLMLIGVAWTLATVTWLLMRRTRHGLLTRAAAQNPVMAAGLGVNTRRVATWTFAYGAGLAGAAGAVLAPVVGVIPTMGQLYVARSFMAVIVGGPAFLAGTIGASTVLGTVENLVSRGYTPVIGQAMLLVAAIVILRFLPQGLTGLRQRGGLV
ncbi:MAG: branched-chain amino acid ABC transporter permease [Acidimicrobiia bacterium]|nr:branched-chain amino acid ABC transporter permease [Acidimicrobiia bacterium]